MYKWLAAFKASVTTVREKQNNDSTANIIAKAIYLLIRSYNVFEIENL